VHSDLEEEDMQDQDKKIKTPDKDSLRLIEGEYQENKGRSIIDRITNRDIIKKNEEKIEELESINNELEGKINQVLDLLEVINEIDKKLTYFEKQVYRGKIPKEIPDINIEDEDKE